MFASTIRENLRLARPEATDDELLEALGRARLADWVATLPDGLDTLVGEDGVGSRAASASVSSSRARCSRTRRSSSSTSRRRTSTLRPPRPSCATSSTRRTVARSS